MSDQLQYQLPKNIVQSWLDANLIERQTEIWIYPNYPAGFMAVVGAEGEIVYIFESKWGQLKLMDKKRCLGIRPNGSLIY